MTFQKCISYCLKYLLMFLKTEAEILEREKEIFSPTALFSKATVARTGSGQRQGCGIPSRCPI